MSALEVRLVVVDFAHRVNDRCSVMRHCSAYFTRVNKTTQVPAIYICQNDYSLFKNEAAVNLLRYSSAASILPDLHDQEMPMTGTGGVVLYVIQLQ